MSKKTLLFALISFSLLGLQSCKKHHPGPPEDIQLCVQRNNYSYSVQGVGVTDSQMDTVRQLFQQNHLSLANLQVSAMTYTKDYYEDIHIFANQFIGNLAVFYGEMGFNFMKTNGIYTIDSFGIAGQRIQVGRINPDPHITPLHAANVLYQKMTKDLEIGGWNANWKDSCYMVTLGVSLVSGQIAHSDAKYGLVWRVTPQNSEYPVCFVNALSGKLISYFNGIVY